MNFITKALNRLFKSGNQQELNKIKPIVVKINDLEKNFSSLKTENFTEKTQQYKKKACTAFTDRKYVYHPVRTSTQPIYLLSYL